MATTRDRRTTDSLTVRSRGLRRVEGGRDEGGGRKLDWPCRMANFEKRESFTDYSVKGNSV